MKRLHVWETFHTIGAATAYGADHAEADALAGAGACCAPADEAKTEDATQACCAPVATHDTSPKGAVGPR